MFCSLSVRLSTYASLYRSIPVKIDEHALALQLKCFLGGRTLDRRGRGWRFATRAGHLVVEPNSTCLTLPEGRWAGGDYIARWVVTLNSPGKGK